MLNVRRYFFKYLLAVNQYIQENGIRLADISGYILTIVKIGNLFKVELAVEEVTDYTLPPLQRPAHEAHAICLFGTYDG